MRMTTAISWNLKQQKGSLDPMKCSETLPFFQLISNMIRTKNDLAILSHFVLNPHTFILAGSIHTISKAFLDNFLTHWHLFLTFPPCQQIPLFHLCLCCDLCIGMESKHLQFSSKPGRGQALREGCWWRKFSNYQRVLVYHMIYRVLQHIPHSTRLDANTNTSTIWYIMIWSHTMWLFAWYGLFG